MPTQTLIRVHGVQVLGFAADDLIFDRSCAWRDLLAGWLPWWRRADVIRRRGLTRLEYRLVGRHGRILRAFTEEFEPRTGRPRSSLRRGATIAEQAAAWQASFGFRMARTEEPAA
jgi:hypothetical protein